MIDIDPTVERLQARTAELLGKDAAIFMPSGTMTNQVAVRLHCKPGDEFICESGCHIYNYEQGAYAQLSGVATRAVTGDAGGVLQLDQLQDLIRPDNEHLVRTRMLALENTHNRGAGRIQPIDTVAEVCQWAHDNGMRTHLDGARLFNAVAGSGIEAAKWAAHFDTVSVCFSKGLGAPVGSALAGSADLIAEARRHRKLFGGGMRQAGIIAAGALFALEHNRDRLVDDHRNAQILAQAVCQTDGLELASDTVDTNIVIFRIDPLLAAAPEFAAALRERAVLMLPFSQTNIRAVTHLHITEDDAERSADTIHEVAGGFASGSLQVTATEDAY